MLKDKLHILDNIFSHAKSSSLDNVPSKFDWVWSIDPDMTVITDNHVNIVDDVLTKTKIAWLVESPTYMKKSNDFVRLNHWKFDKIFTCNREILDTVENSDLVPIGGCWIPETERVIHKKNKIISIIASNKTFLTGHKLRHEVISKIPKLDVYGRGYKEIPTKLDGLKDYKFSIAIENDKIDYYFTEKIIDCFITGTIPIYWGCPSIGNFFDINGILTFNTIDELNDIINNLDNEYEKRFESVKTNFELSKKYLIADDIIYKKLKL
jgi:hypothetical protein